MKRDLALIGYGEAGSTFARAGRWGGRAAGYDRLSSRREVLAADGLIAAEAVGEGLRGAPLILSLVTADQALAAATDAAAFLQRGALYCDMNSVAPQTKRAAAAAVEAAGGRYVDVAVLAPVEPLRLGVPLLLSGAGAEDAAELLSQAGFSNARLVGPEVGRASAIKMIRSVMVKGVEALTAEMMQAALAAEVAEEVLASLDASDKAQPWSRRAAYNIERMTTHGLRRAEEMEEAAKTLAALGVEPVMTAGTIRRQREQAGSPAHRSGIA